MNNLIVRNAFGTAGRRCRCGSWLQHWYNFTASSRTTCAVINCGFGAEVGGHVTLVGDRAHYIVPLCLGCNTRTDWMLLDSRILPVSANRRDSCDLFAM